MRKSASAVNALFLSLGATGARILERAAKIRILIAFATGVSGVLLAAFVMIFQGCAAASPSNTPAPEKSWVLVRDSKFSVLLPMSPEETVKTNLSSGGWTITQHEFIVDPDPTMEIGIIYNDYSASAENLRVLGSRAFFDKVQAGALKVLGDGHLVSLRDGTFNSYPMRDICFDIPEKKWRYQTRLIVVGARMYQLIVVSSVDTDASRAVSKLFDSFLLLRP